MGIHLFYFLDALFVDNALEWTRTTTPLGTGPQPAAYTIPPRGQFLWVITEAIIHLHVKFVNGFLAVF
jgi:hypothetical protein